MRKSKFRETQIVGMLKDAERGMPEADLLREHGISKLTFFNWRNKYGATSLSRGCFRICPQPDPYFDDRFEVEAPVAGLKSCYRGDETGLSCA